MEVQEKDNQLRNKIRLEVIADREKVQIGLGQPIGFNGCSVVDIATLLKTGFLPSRYFWPVRENFKANGLDVPSYWNSPCCPQYDVLNEVRGWGAAREGKVFRKQITARVEEFRSFFGFLIGTPFEALLEPVERRIRNELFKLKGARVALSASALRDRRVVMESDPWFDRRHKAQNTFIAIRARYFDKNQVHAGLGLGIPAEHILEIAPYGERELKILKNMLS